jgi:FkbM family methyltransferase
MGNYLRPLIGRALRAARYRLDALRGPYIVFDVGASNGKQFLQRCREDRNTVVYAFEPEPRSFESVLANTRGLASFHAYPFAVSVVEGERPFNVASVIGNHSFHEFVDGVNATWKDPYVRELPWVPDFSTQAQIRVRTVRLDTFIAEHRIPHISYLHVDAQGEDLNVLRSLGDQVSIVRAGVIEVCLKPLYRNQFTKKDALELLAQLGMTVTHIEPLHFGLVENLYFKRRTHRA